MKRFHRSDDGDAWLIYGIGMTVVLASVSILFVLLGSTRSAAWALAATLLIAGLTLAGSIFTDPNVPRRHASWWHIPANPYERIAYADALTMWGGCGAFVVGSLGACVCLVAGWGAAAVVVFLAGVLVSIIFLVVAAIIEGMGGQPPLVPYRRLDEVRPFQQARVTPPLPPLARPAAPTTTPEADVATVGHPVPEPSLKPSLNELWDRSQ